MLTADQNRTIVRTSAIYDLIATAGFATPWTVAPTLALVFEAGQAIGLGGAQTTLDPVQMLFANLMGSVVLVWALARLTFPTRAMGRFDALSRALFAIWQLWAVWHGGPTIIIGFTVLEVAFGIAQLLPVKPQAQEGRTIALTQPG